MDDWFPCGASGQTPFSPPHSVLSVPPLDAPRSTAGWSYVEYASVPPGSPHFCLRCLESMPHVACDRHCIIRGGHSHRTCWAPSSGSGFTSQTALSLSALVELHRHGQEALIQLELQIFFTPQFSGSSGWRHWGSSLHRSFVNPRHAPASVTSFTAHLAAWKFLPGVLGWVDCRKGKHHPELCSAQGQI